MKIVRVLSGTFLGLFLLHNFILGQASAAGPSLEDEAKKRAQSIIARSRTQTNKKIKIDDIKSFTIAYESKLPPIEKFEEAVSNSELNVLFPDKIYSHGKGENSGSNSISLFSSVLNADKFDKKVESLSGGKSVAATFNFGTKESQIKEFKWRTWTLIFPITLDVWYYPFDFKFIAVAESKDGKAEVLEAVSASKTVYRLFFDQTSHLLLMMTRSFQTSDGIKVEEKYFFSDYKETNGLIIAHKIEYQQNNELIETRTIKSIKINPELKSEMFNVKEN
jgi:hypothetical protein